MTKTFDDALRAAWDAAAAWKERNQYGETFTSSDDAFYLWRATLADGVKEPA